MWRLQLLRVDHPSPGSEKQIQTFGGCCSQLSFNLVKLSVYKQCPHLRFQEPPVDRYILILTAQLCKRSLRLDTPFTIAVTSIRPYIERFLFFFFLSLNVPSWNFCSLVFPLALFGYTSFNHIPCIVCHATILLLCWCILSAVDFFNQLSSFSLLYFP